MDLVTGLLRLVHIFTGVYWTGLAWFSMLFLLPRIKAAGPEGSRVMARLTAPPFPQFTALAAGLTALSGVLLYALGSAGFDTAWIRTPAGLVLTIGGLAGLLAFGDGFFVSRPATARIATLGGEIQASGGAPSPAQMTEMQQLAGTLERAVFRTAYLLVIAVIAMAISQVV